MHLDPDPPEFPDGHRQIESSKPDSIVSSITLPVLAGHNNWPAPAQHSLSEQHMAQGLSIWIYGGERLEPAGLDFILLFYFYKRVDLANLFRNNGVNVT